MRHSLSESLSDVVQKINLISNQVNTKAQQDKITAQQLEKIDKVNFNEFEKKIVNELAKDIGRSTTGRLGVKIPSKIVGQNVTQFGLKKNDVLLTINNIPIGNVSGIYNLYKDETIKTYFVEIKRMNKLIMIEWYK